uniref:Reverse transcriptase Ty1/copia-type domain-containing protein n=1 Tax=Solanum lycopersicum TaxID=4081 RepID=A0A3Q7EBG3_SOLLC
MAFSVSLVFQFMHSPLDIHFTAVKHILRYLRGSINHGLFIPGGLIGSLTCYTDADWAVCPTTHRSTSAFASFLKQSFVSRSSAEEKYRSVAHDTSKISWLLSLLADLQIQLSFPSTIYCDNIVSSLRAKCGSKNADLLTKSLPYAQFSFLHDKLNICRDPASLEGNDKYMYS